MYLVHGRCVSFVGDPSVWKSTFVWWCYGRVWCASAKWRIGSELRWAWLYWFMD